MEIISVSLFSLLRNWQLCVFIIENVRNAYINVILVVCSIVVRMTDKIHNRPDIVIGRVNLLFEIDICFVIITDEIIYSSLK